MVVDGDGPQAMQEEQERRVHIMKQVPGLTALRAQRKSYFGGPADEEAANRETIIKIMQSATCSEALLQ